jgi:hypothetical protein
VLFLDVELTFFSLQNWELILSQCQKEFSHGTNFVEHLIESLKLVSDDAREQTISKLFDNTDVQNYFKGICIAKKGSQNLFLSFHY